MNTDIDSLDQGPDWLTVTADGKRHVDRLRRQAERWVYGWGKPAPWRWLGYVGKRFHDPDGRGGAAFGEREGGCMAVFQSWGAMAGMSGAAIVNGERFWMPGDRALDNEGPKVTRCDVQVTVLHKEQTPSIRDIMGTLPGDKHHFSAVIPLNLEGGTLYVGHRASDIFGRMYDKGAHLGGGEIPHRMLWRYEVEYKRKPAQSMAALLWGPAVDSTRRRQIIIRNVETFFREHGVPVPFVDDLDGAHSVVRYATRHQDDERTLRWLTQQVQPAILRLSQGGRTQRVADALGLQIIDGVPTFEATEIVPSTQLSLDDWLAL